MKTKRSLFQPSFSSKLEDRRTSNSTEKQSKSDPDTLTGLRDFHSVNALGEEINVIEKASHGVETGYDIVPWKTFEKSWVKRALVF